MLRSFLYHSRWFISLLILAVGGTGCSRKFYRSRTDDDVVGLLTQKNQFPDWEIKHWHIYPDPRARFGDTTNPDRPPKPPDDLAAYLLSPDPQPRSARKTRMVEGDGYLEYLENWDAENRALRTTPAKTNIDQPANYAQGEFSATGSYDRALKQNEKTYLINLPQSVELALFNSREFQDRREDLYGAALPVTVERFSFISQFFATERAVREATGSETAQGAGSRWRLDSNGGFTKLFPTGALLLVQMANRLVVELGHGRPDVSLSNLTMEITQPLLQGGGYAFTMENLTQTERNLLYALRSYARFRKVHYTYLAGGADNLFNSPYSYAGLSLRGVGPTLSATGQGYYPTILLSFLEKNEVENINGLERFWRQYQAFEEGGDVSRLQVDQVEQNLLSGRSRLLQRRQDLQNGVDQFKLQLGLPTPLPLELDETPMKPLTDHLARIGTIRDEFDAIRRTAGDYPTVIRRPILAMAGGLFSVVPFDVPVRQRLRELFVNSPAVKGTQFQKTILERWAPWEKLDDNATRTRITFMVEEQQKLLEQKALIETDNRKLTPAQEERLQKLRSDINLGRFELSVKNYERRPWLKEPGGRRAKEQENVFREVINWFILVFGEAREERLAKIRQAWPTLPDVTVDGVDLLTDDLDKAQTVAAQTALTNRLELMNARGQLVDSWRQIAVRANSLMGVLNVGYHYDTASPAGANRPLELGEGRDRHQLIINGELPLVRRVERNNYRTALIGYQRQRRLLQANEDFVLNDVRGGLRQLRVLAENYKIQQRAVELAYALVENSLDVLQAPPDPRNVGGQSAGNAAALTQQLLNAQSSLLQAQNALYTVWINYLIARMTFYRDLELLPLDPRGVWIDEYSPESTNRIRPADGGPPLERLPWPDPVPRNGAAPPRQELLPTGGTGGDAHWQKSKP